MLVIKSLLFVRKHWSYGTMKSNKNITFNVTVGLIRIIL